jgi:uncharacterized protein
MLSVFKNINEVHIEVTNMCNLSCTYCYAETILPGKRLSLFTNELYRTTIDKIFQKTKSDFVDIIFHGGEPLLHKAEWFDEACSYAISKAELLGKKVTFGMQSNLTLLSDAHIEIFIKYNLKIGVSLDGDEVTHNEMRGSFKRTIRNIQKLQLAGIFGGVIIVISHHNYNKIHSFFQLLRQLEIETFHMNIASSVGRGNPLELLGSDKTFKAFRDCIDAMLFYEGTILDTRMLDKINQFLNPPIATEELYKILRCDNAFCHAGVTMVAIQNDGNIYPCGCAGSSGNMKNFKLDNIASKEENPFAFFEKLKLFHTKKNKYYNECMTCEARFVCEHGCPAFDHTDSITPENTCIATKQLYHYLQQIDRTLLEQLVNKFYQSKMAN